jgi:hypothetical protein
VRGKRSGRLPPFRDSRGDEFDEAHDHFDSYSSNRRERGRLFTSDGKAERKKKGAASTDENTTIPKKWTHPRSRGGGLREERADERRGARERGDRKEGAHQENAEGAPLRLGGTDEILIHDGNCISNPPKRDAAKTDEQDPDERLR